MGDVDGVLYRDGGNGRGGFSSKTRLATGWIYLGGLLMRHLLRRAAAATAGLVAVAGLGLPASARAEEPGVVIPTGGVWGLDFAGGVLHSVETAPSGDQAVVTRLVSPDATSVAAPVYETFAIGMKTEPCEAGACVMLRGNGNGDTGVVAVQPDGTDRFHLLISKNSLSPGAESGSGMRITDVTGRYYVYDVASTAKQYADDYARYHPTDANSLTRKTGAGSLWGAGLWNASTTAGVVTVTDLEQQKVTGTVATGAPCVIKELQVVGRWLYWSCGADGPAGVYDRTAGRKISVPSGPALVSDGYLVRHDRTAGKLMLTEFRSGVTREVADLPAGRTADQRRQTWAVDKFGGDIAYLGPDQAIHVVPSGVPAEPLTKIESEVDYPYPWAFEDPRVWASTWQLSRPANWALTLKDRAGRTVRTVRGGPGAEVDVVWDGKGDDGQYVLSGPYTWTVTATPVDGAGTAAVSGTFTLGHGRQGHHDQRGAYYGDIVTLNSKGGLTTHEGGGNGTFPTKETGTGWSAGTVAVPFGDMNGDRCAELLVRMPGGELRRYDGKCNGIYSPGSTHATLGTGWNAYNVLTTPGDLTGDGRADLLARKSSTGDLYLFADNGAGKLKAGVRIRTGWAAYNLIAGAGDLNGDGHGDLLTRHKDGTLYWYAGLGTGQFKERVKIFSGWGGSYVSLIGAGDITGDGKADLVVRDKSGVLYRNNGNGKGGFSSKTKIATGWTYLGVF
ncbi:FG-GAP-like repeat-containing protein [Streptomyces smaragdinus]|uniref:FG-GAP-like repeat-containing protein n=1 Tax=Streptomyces smaragdinus TaxID=2585196 RepID=UPI0012974A73|nr:FG-GAP-like repeat-containing protein [Streptomyces smaragdinus]